MKLTVDRVERMTVGALATSFVGIQPQTHTDAVVGQLLDKLNKDRVRIAHFKGRAATEKRLRTNVGQHMCGRSWLPSGASEHPLEERSPGLGRLSLPHIRGFLKEHTAVNG